MVAAKPFENDRDPSPMLRSLPQQLDHPTRVREPMVRKGWLARREGSDRAGRGREPFVAVSWEKALDLLAAEQQRVIADKGNSAIYGGSYGWASAGRLHSATGLLKRYLGLTGGFTDSVGTYSFAAGGVILPHVIGRAGAASSWSSLVGETRLFVAFGGVPLKNAQITHGGMAEHNTRFWLTRMRGTGCRFVNVGPLRDDLTDEIGARWIPVRPSTDTAFILALCHTLLEEGLHDAEFLRSHCVGFERFAAYLTGSVDGIVKSAQWAAPITAIDAAAIRDLARQMASHSTVINLAWSLQRTDHGEQPYWAAVALAAMLGGIGRPGQGLAVGYGAMGGVGESRQPLPTPHFPGVKNPLDSFIPVARIADMLLNPGASFDFNGRRASYPDIDLIWWAGGNPFHHHQDINRLLAAWRRPATIVFNETHWTAAARHADIVLPVASALERDDIGCCSFDRYYYAMHKFADPPGQARLEFDVMADLAERFGVRQEFTQGKAPDQWLRQLWTGVREGALKQGAALPDFDAFWARGFVAVPAPHEKYVDFATFRRDPDAHPLQTPSGKIELFSATIDGFGYADCAGHPTWYEPLEWLGDPELAARFPLHLVSNQPATRLHSQLDAGEVSLQSKVQGREPVMIHPDDAAPRGIASGDVVRLFNDRGACLAGAVVSDRVAAGVIQMATGAWYDPLEPGEIGTLDVHGNPNLVTPDKGTSALAQGPISHTALVQVERWSGEVPPVRVFDPPAVEPQ